MVQGKNQILGRDVCKTKSSIRTLPLFSCIEEMLLKIKAQEQEDKRFFGMDYYNEYDDYIYRQPNGKIVKPGYVTQHFANLIIKKNPQLRKVRFHDLRHSCATLLRNEGVSMGDIQKWLGHSAITTTVNTKYGHTKEKNQIEEIKVALIQCTK